MKISMAKDVISPYSAIKHEAFPHVYQGAEEKFSPGPGSTAKKTNLRQKGGLLVGSEVVGGFNPDRYTP